MTFDAAVHGDWSAFLDTLIQGDIPVIIRRAPLTTWRAVDWTADVIASYLPGPLQHISPAHMFASGRFALSLSCSRSNDAQCQALSTQRSFCLPLRHAPGERPRRHGRVPLPLLTPRHDYDTGEG